MWREIVNGLIEITAEYEMGDVWRKLMYWLVEISTKGELNEGGREVVNWPVEEAGRQGGKELEGVGQLDC